MCTKIQLKEFLEEISQEAKFAKFDYAFPETFRVIVKCKIAENKIVVYYNNYVRNWINRFSAFTSTAWVVRPGYPAVKYSMYRKTYSCHHSTKNKSMTSHRSGNRQCEAKISFKIIFLNGNAFKNDLYLQEGLNMTIDIDFDHSHLVRNKDSLSLPDSTDSYAAFYEYFDDGYLPSTAKFYHLLQLKEKYGQDSEEQENSNLNPDSRLIQYIYKHRWNKRESNVKDVIRRKFETLRNQGYTAGYSPGADPFVVIVTPLMKRVISQIGVQRVLIDATLQPGTPFTLFLYVPSMIGSLPVACILFSEKTEATYDQIFVTLKPAIANACDNISFTPELLLHDCNTEIQQALNILFPNAMTKLNRYSLCRDIWRWICSETSHLTPGYKLYLMSLFKDMVFAKSENDALEFYDKIRGYISTRPSKAEEVWQAREQWLDESGLGDGFNDAPIVFLKEFILQLCQPFNGFLPTMVDVVTNVIEPHYHKILLSHRDGDVTNVYTKFIAKASIDTVSNLLRVDGPVEYSVRDNINKRLFYQLNMSTMCCVCRVGIMGRMCEHLCGILNVNDDNTFVLFSSLNGNDKDAFLKILGDETTAVKYENEHDLLEIEEAAVDDESLETTVKNEVEDPLEETDAKVNFASEDTTRVEVKEQYEAGLKALNDEFGRLFKLLKENPNETNLYTMRRLETELAKIVVVNEVDTSNTFVASNEETGED